MIAFFRRIILAFLPACAALGVWEWWAGGDRHTAFLLGSPSGILASLRMLAAHGDLARHFFITLWEAFAGLVIGMAAGSALGLALSRTPHLERFSRPYLLAFGAVPMVAIGPVLVFWMGTGTGAKVLIAALCTAPVALAQARTGASTANRELVEMARTFGVPERRIFWRLVTPAAILWMLASLRLNVGLALLGAFSGEFLSSRAGLGHLIIVAEGLYDLNGMWAGVVGIIVAALVLHASAIPLESWARRFTLSQSNN